MKWFYRLMRLFSLTDEMVLSLDEIVSTALHKLVAMKTIFGHGPARRNMQQFCDKITAST